MAEEAEGADARWANRNRSRSRETTVAVAAEWRYFARTLYHLAGAPPLTGYPPYIVKRIMWGDTQPDGPFFEELLVVFEKLLGDREMRAGHGTRRPGPIEQADGLGRAGQARVPAPNGARFWPSAETIPLNPQAVETVEGFLRLLSLLLKWRRMSLRSLEAKAKMRAEWLPKSTVSDLFRGKKLPTQPALMSILALCDVPTAEHGKWVDARNRLSMAPGASTSRLKARRGAPRTGKAG